VQLVLNKVNINNEPWFVDAFHVTFWIEMFFNCYDFNNGDITFAQWPDGGSYLDQDNKTLAVFTSLRAGVDRYIKSERRREELKAKR
jgi:hypothetical protein